MDVISSLQNPRVQQAVKLRDARQRKKQGRIIIDGAREVLRAITGGLQLSESFICESLCQSDNCREALTTLKQTSTELIHVAPAVMAKLAYGDRSDGIVAVAPTPQHSLDQLRLPRDPLAIVLEGVEKPGNVGAVLRSADGAGCSAVIVADAGTDLYNPNTIRASLGTVFTVNVCTASAQETLTWLRDQRLTIFAARVNAQQLYTSANFNGPTAFVLGSELAGLSPHWHAGDITPIRLPMLGATDSLNVSAAAAVLMYEARRQRTP